MKSIAALALLLGLATAAPAHADADVWARLKQGDRVVLVRHADAPGGAGDPAGFKLDDCSTQRNLSERGRAQARELGATIRARGIKVGKVLVSQWCRCRETAALMEIGAIEEAPTFNNALVLHERRDALTRGAREAIEAWTGPGALFVVTHGANILPLTGLHVAQAEMVVVEPGMTSEGRLRVLGRIAPRS